jgi:hypothetical protein
MPQNPTHLAIHNLVAVGALGGRVVPVLLATVKRQIKPNLDLVRVEALHRLKLCLSHCVQLTA